MQRGIIELTNAEIIDALQKLDIPRFQGTDLIRKLQAASASSSVVTQIELSAEELENLLDEIIMPSENDLESMKSLRRKIQAKLMEYNQATNA